MTDGVTLTFVDLSEQDEATIIVRPAKEGIALAVSLMSNGDIEVVMPKTTAQELARALAKAVG